MFYDHITLRFSVRHHLKKLIIYKIFTKKINADSENEYKYIYG